MKQINGFDSLCQLQRENHKYLKIREILEWDQACSMPEAAASYRGDLTGLIEKIRHQSWTSSNFLEALESAEREFNHQPESGWQKRQITLCRRQYQSFNKLPASFSEAYAKKQAVALASWEKARKERKFTPFRDPLKALVEANQEKARLLGFENHPYDALLQAYEYGFSVKKLDELFQSLSTFLTKFIQETTRPETTHEKSGCQERYSLKHQKSFCKDLARQLGFQSTNGVLTTSSHPFSATLGQGDYRITTRYQDNDFLSSFFAVAHEMGHSLYEQGLPSDWWGLEIGQAASCGIHESQSLFWEHKICGAREFLRPWHMKFSKAFSKELVNPDFDQFIKQTREVSPGLIRVTSDEICYSLHIIIRYEIEKKLLDGSLDAGQLPEIWNDLYKSHLGVTPENDTEGCLQDIHWAFGEFGYFPSYALGHLYSSQIADTMRHEISLPETSPFTEQSGDSVRTWLKTNIHSNGAHFDPLDLIEHISGQPLSTKFFEDYVTQKYHLS